MISGQKTTKLLKEIREHLNKYQAHRLEDAVL